MMCAVCAWLYVATRRVRWMDVRLWIAMGADGGASCVVWWVDGVVQYVREMTAHACVRV